MLKFRGSLQKLAHECVKTMETPKSFHIMVTDLNHHVRDLLIRELEKEGYTVFSVKTGPMLYEYLSRQTILDLLILDPELFDAYDHGLLRQVLSQKSAKTIILHTYKDIFEEYRPSAHIHLVEKCAESINSLKAAIHSCYLNSLKNTATHPPA